MADGSAGSLTSSSGCDAVGGGGVRGRYTDESSSEHWKETSSQMFLVGGTGSRVGGVRLGVRTHRDPEYGGGGNGRQRSPARRIDRHPSGGSVNGLSRSTDDGRRRNSPRGTLRRARPNSEDGSGIRVAELTTTGTSDLAHSQVKAGIVEDRCCGGGARVLRGIKCMYTCNAPRHRSAKCCCGGLLYLFVLGWLGLPLLGLILFFSVREIQFLGAFSLFLVPPVVYLHGLWYYRQPHIFDLLAEVMTFRDEFVSRAERTIRRHMVAIVFLIPLSTIVFGVSFFTSQPLNAIEEIKNPKLYQTLIVPFFFVAILILTYTILFAAVFSIVWSLHRLQVEDFVEAVTVDRNARPPGVDSIIDAHETLMKKINSSCRHWRGAYTLCTILSLSGILLMLYMITIAQKFYKELIPFASLLIFCTMIAQFYLFYCIYRINRSLRSIRDVLLQAQLKLPVTSNERICLALHAYAIKSTIPIFGFTGTYTVDAVLCVMVSGCFLLGDIAF